VVLGVLLLAGATLLPSGVLAAPRASAVKAQGLSSAQASTAVTLGAASAASTAPGTTVTMSGGDLLGLSSGVLVQFVNTSSVPLRPTSSASIKVNLSGFSLLANASAWVCSGTWSGIMCVGGTMTQVAISTSNGGVGVLPAWAVPRAMGESREVIVKSGSVLSAGSVNVGSSVTY
jgi:hypothetical protein